MKVLLFNPTAAPTLVAAVAVTAAVATPAAFVVTPAAFVAWTGRVFAYEGDAGGNEPPEGYLMELAEAPLDLNSAGPDELALLPGISPSAARAIVQRRANLGCFRSMRDLVGAGGLSEPAIARIRPYVSLGSGCNGGKLLSWEARGSVWDSDSKATSSAAGAGRAGDAYFQLGRADIASADARLRVKYRVGDPQAIGGIRMSLGSAILTAGDIRAAGPLTLALDLGRGAFTHDGPFPPSQLLSRDGDAAREKPLENAAPSVTGTGRAGSQPGAEPMCRRFTMARVATGGGERLRGMGLQSRGRLHATLLAGTVVESWGEKRGFAGVFWTRCLVRPGCELWGGASLAAGREGAGREGSATSNCQISAVALAGAVACRESAQWSAEVAAGACGGAWLFSLRAEPAVRSRVGMAVAGRWGRYRNPLGLRPFRSPGASELLARTVAEVHRAPLGSLSVEQLFDSEAGRSARLRRYLTWRKRLRKGTWVEGDLRDESFRGQRLSGTAGLKLIWRPSHGGWAEVLCKTMNLESSASILVGWRAGRGRGPIRMEMGGFSFNSARALYFYEREIVGRSSIKALKGQGIGWYLYLCLEPDSGPRPLRFLGSAEIKLRRFVRWDPPCCGTFFGVQVGRRGGYEGKG